MQKRQETVSTKTVNEQFDKYKEGFVIVHGIES
jgi:L-asparaginase/Glu-tRNA(Gln) amidotransferase subunit D